MLLERLPPRVLTTKARQLTVSTILERSLIKGDYFLVGLASGRTK
jgi:hypothetical protein